MNLQTWAMKIMRGSTISTALESFEITIEFYNALIEDSSPRMRLQCCLIVLYCNYDDTVHHNVCASIVKLCCIVTMTIQYITTYVPGLLSYTVL